MSGLRNTFGSPSGRHVNFMAPVIVGLATLFLASCSGGAAGQPAPPPPPAAVVTFNPADGAKGVIPKDPISAKVTNGKIINAVFTGQDGKQLRGNTAPDGLSWTSDEVLGYSKTYTLEVTAQGVSGPPVVQRSVFNTVAPKNQTYLSMTPQDGQSVGIGQPLAFYFSKDAPPPDKAKAEAAIKIKTEPAVEGAFYWFNSREVHWRPKEYWKPGTKITVDADIYGHDFGRGVYGEEDRHARFTIGRSVILRADGASHQMSIEIDGAVVRTLPVSLGSPDHPSNNGPHVVTESHPVFHMDSTTFGLPLDQGGYSTDVKWAVRISNDGEFLHAAPWSVGDQGHRNVSHGCINMSDADSKWVFDQLKKGDVVEITNSGGPGLRSWDGFGDWTVPWQQWVAGNR